jgi:hypothetical protein
MDELEEPLGKQPASETTPSGSQAELRALLSTLVDVASEAEARPYADILERLMGDASYYEKASRAARSAGLAFIRSHRGRFGEVAEGLLDEHRARLEARTAQALSLV